MTRIDAIVVGGGIAGLATAYELHRRGVSFAVFERSRRPGGVIHSEEFEGFTIDAGPDSLLTQKPEGIRLCEELGLGERLVATLPPRVAYVQRGGRLHALPAASVLGIPTRLGPFARTTLFTWLGKARMGAEILVPPRRGTDDESIGSFMRRRFGHESVDYLAEPLLAGIHAGDVDRLSMRALFPRFVEAEESHGSLLLAFRRQARRRRPTSGDAGAFKSLPGGLSEMIDALVRALPASSIRLDTPVGSVKAAATSADGQRDGYAFDVETASREIVRARTVVLATPAFVTARITRDIDRELAKGFDEVPYASTGTVALAFPRSAVQHRLAGSGFVVPRLEGSGILACTWLSSKWPHRAPADKVLLRAFVGGARDPGALERDDCDLISRSLMALRPLLGITGDPLFARVYRFERASAQHEVGHMGRVAAIERALARVPGLFATGSGLRCVGIPDCVADGRATAAAVAGRLAGASS